MATAAPVPAAPESGDESATGDAPEGRRLDARAPEGDGPVTPRVVHEDANVKIAVVSIRAEATMEEHATPIPVTILGVSGTGTLSIGGEPHALDPGALYHLDAHAPHALKAEGEAPLVVMVHYLKRGT